MVALWLAWGDEAIGTYIVNSAFNESVCLLSWRYCCVWSAEKLYAWTLARSKSRKYLRTFLCPRISFCPFSSSRFHVKKDMYKSLSLPSGVDSALRSCMLHSEKSDLRIILRCPRQFNNKLRIWYRVFVKQPGLRMTGTAASRKQE